MRLDVVPDTLAERAGVTLGLAPRPAGYTFLALAVARTVGSAQRLGVFAALARGRRTAQDLAAELGLRPVPLRMALDLLAGEGLLAWRRGRYGLSRQGRRWLDPASGHYVGTYVDHSVDYVAWWDGLERVLRDGSSFRLHDAPADDPSWARYVRGQYELARLSAPAVARAVRLPAGARSLLDVAGGHGEYAAALCRRHPGLRALVVDLPGAVRVGRELLRADGMSGRVEHREGDVFEAELGGPHDGALAFSILHHLTPERCVRLLERVRAALRPGATLAVLDLFRPDRGRPRRSSAAVFELFFHLTSGVDTPSEAALRRWLAAAGFGPARGRALATLPDLRLYTARAV